MKTNLLIKQFSSLFLFNLNKKNLTNKYIMNNNPKILAISKQNN